MDPIQILSLGVALGVKVLIALNSAWNLLNFRSGLIKSLVSQGHQVVLAAPADEHVASLTALGASFVDLPMRSHGTNPLADLWVLGRFVRLLNSERPDVMLAYTAKPNIYGGLAAHCLGIPVINNIAGLGSVFIREGWLTRLLEALYRLALTRSRRVFFQNPDDEQLFLSKGLVRLGQTTLLPGSGVDLKRFQPVPLPSTQSTNKEPSQRRFVFLMVARLLGDKGVHEYVEAAGLLRDRYPMAQFALLGFIDRSNPNAVTSERLSAWVRSGVLSYWGSSSDVRTELALADCVVLPSYREGTPRTLLEAAAMGRPLIATDVPGCREVVCDGVNGLLCKPREATDLARQMEAILCMSQERIQKMAEASRQLVQARFDEQIVIEQYKQAISALA